MEFGYTEDSFHTLTGMEQLGLVGLTLVLSIGLLALGGRLRGVVWAFILFWGFVWLSPQVYYLYYQVIFDGLPWQIVVKTPPGPGRILNLLTFQGAGTLSDHGKGVLGWGLIGMALWRRRRARLSSPKELT
jgi:hypothetical protein